MAAEGCFKDKTSYNFHMIKHHHRKDYDQLKGSGTQEGDEFFRVKEEKEPEYDPIKEDWKVALEYYPELDKLYKE